MGGPGGGGAKRNAWMSSSVVAIFFGYL